MSRSLDSFKVTCDETPCLEKSKKVYTLTHELPLFSTAEEARACKIVIPDHIPNEALYIGNGVFEWIKV